MRLLVVLTTTWANVVDDSLCLQKILLIYSIFKTILNEVSLLLCKNQLLFRRKIKNVSSFATDIFLNFLNNDDSLAFIQAQDHIIIETKDCNEEYANIRGSLQE